MKQKQAIPEKALYRPDEFAALLGVSEETVRRWARRKLILHIHLPGKGIRIPHDEYLRIREGVLGSH